MQSVDVIEELAGLKVTTVVPERGGNMPRFRRRLLSNSILILLLSEIGIVLMAAYIGSSTHARFGGPSSLNGPSHPAGEILFTFIMLLCMGGLGMYQKERSSGFKRCFFRLLPAGGLALGITALIALFVPTLRFDTNSLLLVSLFTFAGITFSRSIYARSIEKSESRTRLVFLGAGESAGDCQQLISKSKLSKKYHIVGFISLEGEISKISPRELIVREENSIPMLVKQLKAAELIVSVDNRRSGKFPIAQLLQCKLNGIKVTDSTAFFERELCQIRLGSLQPSWLVFGHGFDQSLFRVACKRTVDFAMSTLLCLVTWPLLLITAAAIVIEDGGPIFYRQERVGLGGRTFMVLKFRSMRKDAEVAGNPQWAASNDDRATKVGRFIRKFRIDEIPQIINVLRGEMSFVGPRPERPFFVDQLIKDIQFYDVRHSIKPGITGMAQVRYQYGASVEDAVQKLQYDLYYVKNNSLVVDALIIYETLHVVVFGKGAR
jgi:sugar transferase (PEP-CTERM system associated)